MVDYLQQIADIDAQIGVLESAIPAQISRANDWRSDAHNRCSGTSKKKRACEAEKARKIRLANSIMGSVTASRTKITALEATKETFVASQHAKDAATVNLSTTGQSLEALVIKADGEATAKKESAKIVANAQAEATKLKSSVEAQGMADKANADLETSSKQNNTMMIIVVVVVLIGVAFGVMKLKKMAK